MKKPIHNDLVFNYLTLTIRYLLILTIVFAGYGCKNEDPQIPSATIKSISPTSGQPNTIVEIRGSNFSKKASDNSVTFNTVSAEVVSASDTLLQVKTPLQGSSGTVEVAVRGEKIVGPEFKYYSLYSYGGKDLFPAYWKDGTSTSFSRKGYLYDLALANEKVYAIGYESNPTVRAKYWENGDTVSVEGVNASTKFRRIAVDGQDVYICGVSAQPMTGHSIVKCWKNKKLLYSIEPDGDFNAEVNDIAVVNGNVYMVGLYFLRPAFWKNGVLTPLPTGNSWSYDATRLRIIDSDIHIIGSRRGSPYINPVIYWKNGTRLPIGDDVRGHATDFAISGSDFYVGGYEHDYQGHLSYFSVAKYWINNVEKTLSNGTDNRYCAAIEVTDDALYVLHNQVSSGNYPYYSNLTKNGLDITPNYGTGVTGSINGIKVIYY